MHFSVAGSSSFTIRAPHQVGGTPMCQKHLKQEAGPGEQPNGVSRGCVKCMTVNSLQSADRKLNYCTRHYVNHKSYGFLKTIHETCSSSITNISINIGNFERKRVYSHWTRSLLLCKDINAFRLPVNQPSISALIYMAFSGLVVWTKPQWYWQTAHSNICVHWFGVLMC